MSKSNDQQRRRQLEEEFKNELASGHSPLPEASSKRILESIHARLEEREAQKSRRLPWLKTKWTAAATTAVAASVLILTVSLWRLHPSKPPVENPVPTQTVRTNNTDHDIRLILPDHSTVELSPQSTLSYYPAFEPGRRAITLTGKALFDVTADPARPFTVSAGSINTTVLGTRFIVSTLGSVQVHLLEGKVVLHSTDNSLALQEVYLNPGQRFVLDSGHKHYTISNTVDSPMAITQKKAQTPAVTSTPADTSILEFNQEPLPHVLDAIGRKYGVVFRFSGHGFNTMSVTGKFLPSDSLSSVLTMLGSINGLQFSRTGDTIVVARSRP